MTRGAQPTDRARRDGSATPAFERLRAVRILVELADDAVARECSLGHQRAMKQAAGRPCDEVDLAELDELHGPG